MATLVAPTWAPADEYDIKFKQALENLSSSTDQVLLSRSSVASGPQDEEQSRLSLQAKSYFDLKAYVLTGKDFPANEAAFDATLPKDGFRRLETVDKKIYGATKKVAVDVGRTCSAFHQDHLYQMVHAGSVAKSWSQSTLELLSEAPEINLYAQLMVLSDPKYKTKNDQDEAFRSAKSGADLTLTMLRETAEDSRDQAQKIQSAMIKFRDDTNPIVPGLKDLVQKYDKEPVTYDGKAVEGYIAYLNADYADALAKVSDKLKEYNGKYEQWKTVTGKVVKMAAGIAWLPGFGWVALAYASREARVLQDAWKNLWDNYKALKEESENEARLIDFATKLVAQFDDLDDKIQAAIDAIATLISMFQTQGNSYDQIQTALRHLGTGSQSDDAANRLSYIKYYLGLSIKKLKDLNAASSGFLEAIANDKEAIVSQS